MRNKQHFSSTLFLFIYFLSKAVLFFFSQKVMVLSVGKGDTDFPQYLMFGAYIYLFPYVCVTRPADALLANSIRAVVIYVLQMSRYNCTLW